MEEKKYSIEPDDGKFTGLSRKQYWQILIVIAACALLWNFLIPPERKLENKFFIMGTLAQTVIYAEQEPAEKAAAKIHEIFSSVEDKCNIFKPESEISRLNATAYQKPFKCSPLLWSMFNSSRYAYKISGGTFDVTARPLMLLWGFYRKRGDSFPGAKEIEAAKSKVGLDKVIFDDKNHTVKFTVPDMSVDLGGIAKGIAVQRAVDKIKEMGIKCALVNLGGNMYCLGQPPGSGSAYRIGIKNPLDKEHVCAGVFLHNQATATSGNYERYVTINGHHYTHIMNPRTGRPVEDMLSVTVVADDAGIADLLSTTVFINGAEFAKSFCEKNPDIGIFMIRRLPADKSKIETLKFGKL